MQKRRRTACVTGINITLKAGVDLGAQIGVDRTPMPRPTCSDRRHYGVAMRRTAQRQQSMHDLADNRFDRAAARANALARLESGITDHCAHNASPTTQPYTECKGPIYDCVHADIPENGPGQQFFTFRSLLRTT